MADNFLADQQVTENHVSVNKRIQAYIENIEVNSRSHPVRALTLVKEATQLLQKQPNSQSNNQALINISNAKAYALYILACYKDAMSAAQTAERLAREDKVSSALARALAIQGHVLQAVNAPGGSA